MIKKLVLSFSLACSVVFASEVVLKTNQGDIKLKIYDDAAPKAALNFKTHAKNGYYDGVIFHRVIKGFMMQGGDPTGSGTGGKSIWGKDFEDEFESKLTFDKAGLLAMANAGRNTNGSQFFITFNPTSWLNGYHTIFGEVIDGMDIVRKIENTKTDKKDRPIDEIKIISAEVIE
ncbi:peptidyl-prolyl cis-trans isomerase B [Campylobacter corcagiensis]|nr:peptidyl-prolyl cis-trans isomerase B [Campylobacter corcagiensis]